MFSLEDVIDKFLSLKDTVHSLHFFKLLNQAEVDQITISNYTDVMKSGIVVQKLQNRLLFGDITDYENFETFMQTHVILTFFYEQWIVQCN